MPVALADVCVEPNCNAPVRCAEMHWQPRGRLQVCREEGRPLRGLRHGRGTLQAQGQEMPQETKQVRRCQVRHDPGAKGRPAPCARRRPLSAALRCETTSSTCVASMRVCRVRTRLSLVHACFCAASRWPPARADTPMPIAVSCAATHACLGRGAARRCASKSARSNLSATSARTSASIAPPKPRATRKTKVVVARPRACAHGHTSGIAML